MMDGLKFLFYSRGECQECVVLFFPTPRFFPRGFSWKGFLRRQTSWVAILPSCLWVDAGRSLDSRVFLFLYLVRWFVI